eukprot:gene706-875_t
MNTFTKDIYSSISDNYKNSRQSYDDHVYKLIKENTDEKRNLAIDVGCGNGQNTIRLAELYDKVIGYDSSESQVLHAEPHDRVEYRACPAENINDLPDGSVDLITAATAAHWFNLPEFFKVTQKLLRPNGSLILWTYRTNDIIGNEKANNIQNKVFDLYKPYRPNNLDLVANGYKDIIPPFKNTTRYNTYTTRKISIEQHVRYFGSLAAYSNYLKAGNKDILEDIKKEMMEAYNTDDEKMIIECKVDFYFIISRKD